MLSILSKKLIFVKVENTLQSLFQVIIYVIMSITFVYFFYVDVVYIKTNMKYVFAVTSVIWIFATLFTFYEWYQNKYKNCKKSSDRLKDDRR